MTKNDQATLDKIKAHADKIRALVPAGSHVLLVWGENVKDVKTSTKVAAASDPCPICRGRIYYA